MGFPKLLACTRCELTFPPDRILSVCQCGSPLMVRYDLAEIRTTWSKQALEHSVTSMWRYEPVLPASRAEAVTLQEGWTPLLPLERLGSEFGARSLWMKDESRNPTASFKARGLSAAVTMARNLGVHKIALASAGNAAGALAAYAALAGLEAHLFMPRDVPQSNFLECRALGARVRLVNGLISDCARMIAEQRDREGWFDASTLKEPYRIEGKKTMGYELAEQMSWQLPDAILYPCGGGVGLIGMWKAFAELEELGWITRKRPRMIAVQAAGCQPIVRAFEQSAATSVYWERAHTLASGLRVPKPPGDFLILEAIRDSGGAALAVSDEEMLDSALLLAEREGLFAAPETGACVAALKRLLRSGFLDPEQQIVIFNTGSGLKYLEAYATRFLHNAPTEQDKLGGLITPR